MGQLYSTLEVGSHHSSRTSLEWALQRLHAVLPHSTGVTYRVYKSETERFSVLCIHQYDENLRVHVLNRELRQRWVEDSHDLKKFVRVSNRNSAFMLYGAPFLIFLKALTIFTFHLRFPSQLFR